MNNKPRVENSATMSAQSQPVTGAIVWILRIEGLCALIISCLVYHHMEMAWRIFFFLFLLPDISFLAYFVNPQIGATAYNICHSYISPFLIGILLLVAKMESVAPYLLIWTAHIGFDRALGYGLKYSSAFGDTHLGFVGKRKNAA
jgi:hypothetical protein